MEIARRILKEINDRLRFLVNVGLDYLNLSRNSGTLSAARASGSAWPARSAPA
jgi:excinuclease ABC subunit A